MKSCLRPNAAAVFLAAAIAAAGQKNPPPPPTTKLHPANPQSQAGSEPWWNLHVANTETVQWHPAFPARYSGPNSLSSQAASTETVDLDVFAGLRLWQGAELHVDGLAWQGFGFNHTLGLEAFPDAMA
jgi:high affinity Mn2+ porin